MFKKKVFEALKGMILDVRLKRALITILLVVITFNFILSLNLEKQNITGQQTTIFQTDCSKISCTEPTQKTCSKGLINKLTRINCCQDFTCRPRDWYENTCSVNDLIEKIQKSENKLTSEELTIAEKAYSVNDEVNLLINSKEKNVNQEKIDAINYQVKTKEKTEDLIALESEENSEVFIGKFVIKNSQEVQETPLIKHVGITDDKELTIIFNSKTAKIPIINCPVIQKPNCGINKELNYSINSQGCVTNYECVCKNLEKPAIQCNGEWVQLNDETACPSSYVCSQQLNCPECSQCPSLEEPKLDFSCSKTIDLGIPRATNFENNKFTITQSAMNKASNNLYIITWNLYNLQKQHLQTQSKELTIIGSNFVDSPQFDQIIETDAIIETFATDSNGNVLGVRSSKIKLK